jgi:hypothetical protein
LPDSQVDTTFHPGAWSRVVLRLPHTGGPSPHLYARQACSGTDDPFLLLFRLRNPYGLSGAG